MAKTAQTYWMIGRNGVLRLFDATDLSKGALRSFEVGGGPTAVARLGSGRVVVCLSDRSLLFSPGLEYIGGITHSGTSFLKTACADIHPDRAILFDQNANLAIKIDTGGSKIEEVWRATTGRLPRGGKVDASGDVWSVGKVGNDLGSDPDQTDVVRLDGATGRMLQNTTIPHIGGRGIAIDSNGAAWVTIFGQQLTGGNPNTGDGKWVYRVTTSGVATAFVLPTENIGGVDVCGPFGIVVDANDHKYIAASRTDRVLKIDGVTEAITTLRDVQGDATAASEPGPLIVDMNRDGNLLCSFKADVAVLHIDVSSGALIEKVDSPGLDKPEDLCDNTGWHTENVLFPGHRLEAGRPESLAEASAVIVESSPWLWLLEFWIDDSTALRLTPSTRPVSFDGNLFYPRNISFSGIDRNTEGNLANLSVSLSPVDAEIQQVLDENDGLVDRTMVIRLVYADLIELGAAAEEFYQVVSCTSDWNTVTWTMGAFDLFKIQFPRQRFIRDHCRHVYKSLSCGYVGDLGPCGKALEDCNARGADEVVHGREQLHPLRYGGAPDIPEKRQ